MATDTRVPHDQLFAEVLQDRYRADPFALWSRLREQPVSRQSDGLWVVSGYPEVHALLADPRLSSDWQRAGEQGRADRLPFIFRDPPRHEWLRRHVMRHFGPPAHPRKISDFEELVTGVVTGELDALAERTGPDRTRMDVLADYTYTVPVTAICRLLGVPARDEHLFHPWVGPTVQVFGNPNATPEQVEASEEASAALNEYLTGIVRRRRADPQDDMISAMVHDDRDGPMGEQEVVSSAALLFIAGHVTTVNATASTVLELLRHPDALRRVRDDPTLVAGAFEEGLRMGGPVQYLLRVALADIPVGDAVLPAGADVRLYVGAANRDPRRFADPDAFDPQRPDNQHLAFNGGPHYCFGAPLARMEARVMLTEWLRRVRNPRLVVDPPPYSTAPAFTGPAELLVDFDGISG